MSRKVTTKEFIKRAKVKHGNSYDYSSIEIDGVDNYIKVGCKKHGDFSIQPSKHMRGRGCKHCAIEARADNRRKTITKVIKDFKKVHDDKYDYSKVKYINADTNVKIRCIEHDCEFEQNPDRHRAGATGCKQCKSRILRNKFIKTRDAFINDAQQVHGNKYDYSRVDYKGAKVNIEIGCPNKLHGYFTQKPDHHINGREGCPICAEEIRNLGFTIEQINKDNIYIDGMLYVINAFNENENFFKIGMTSKTASWRFRGNTEMPYDFEILCEISIGLVDAYKHEQYILEKYKKYKYIPKIYFAGKDEVLSINPLEHDERLQELLKYQKDI